ATCRSDTSPPKTIGGRSFFPGLEINRKMRAEGAEGAALSDCPCRRGALLLLPQHRYRRVLRLRAAGFFAAFFLAFPFAFTAALAIANSLSRFCVRISSNIFMMSKSR